jgi:hypothetical protein
MSEKHQSTGNIESASTSAAPSGTGKEETKPSTAELTKASEARAQPKAEYGGPKGLEPTRYGDWERNGRCYDF